MINLVDISNVVHFDEGNHIYTRLSDGKTLCGVTSMMKLMGVSPDYSGVSDEVLRIAAERGRKIHLSCNMADVFDNFVDCREEMLTGQCINDFNIIILRNILFGFL